MQDHKKLVVFLPVVENGLPHPDLGVRVECGRRESTQVHFQPPTPHSPLLLPQILLHQIRVLRHGLELNPVGTAVHRNGRDRKAEVQPEGRFS